ncbi:MAG: alpha-ketoacid dehydrogenase subunit beta [Mycoplasmoidaceae bacterium]
MSNKNIVVNNIEAVNNALDIALEKNKNVVLYGQDVGFEGGVFRATKGLQKKYGEERVWDSPIAENSMAGVAIGASIGGLIPIMEIQFSGFSFLAMNQIFTHAARMRNRSKGKFNCPIVIRMPMGGGIKALEHHSESLEALYATVPGLKIVLPSNPYDTKGLLLAAINDSDPVIFFEPKKIYRSFKQEIPEVYYEIPIGKANCVRVGKDLTIVSYGSNLIDLIHLVDEMKITNPDISIELIDLRTIKPLDEKTIINSVIKTGRLLVVHEACYSFSVSSEIISRISTKCFYHLKAPPAKVTGWDITVPLAQGEKYQFDLKKRTIDKILEIMENQI